MNDNNLYQKKLEIQRLESELELLRADKRIEQLQKEVDFLKYRKSLSQFQVQEKPIAIISGDSTAKFFNAFGKLGHQLDPNRVYRVGDIEIAINQAVNKNIEEINKYNHVFLKLD